MTARTASRTLILTTLTLALLVAPAAFAAPQGCPMGGCPRGACPGGACSGAWVGAVDVHGETLTVLVVLPAGMSADETMVALLDAEDGPVAAEVMDVSCKPGAGEVTVVVGGDAFGAVGDVTLTLRKPKAELIGSAKNDEGESVTPMFTVTRVAPELACHLTEKAGLEGGVPRGMVEAMEAMKEGFETKDLDKIMSVVSEDFSHYQWPDKATYRAFIESVMIQGELDNAEFDMTYAEFTENEDGTWTVYPIEVMAMFGSATAEITLKKEDDGWRMIGMEVEGI